MTTDISTFYDPEAIHCDWEKGVGDLVSGDDLQTAIIISLFTDRLANADDLHEGDRRGWWGDTDHRIGSRFWLLRREKLTAKIALNAEEYAKEALFWLVEDGVVKSIQIDARIRSPDRLYLTINYTRPDKESQEMFKFYWVWSKNAI
jgi:Mu-like prophage protein gp46